MKIKADEPLRVGGSVIIVMDDGSHLYGTIDAEDKHRIGVHLTLMKDWTEVKPLEEKERCGPFTKFEDGFWGKEVASSPN